MPYLGIQRAVMPCRHSASTRSVFFSGSGFLISAVIAMVADRLVAFPGVSRIPDFLFHMESRPGSWATRLVSVARLPVPPGRGHRSTRRWRRRNLPALVGAAASVSSMPTMPRMGAPFPGWCFAEPARTNDSVFALPKPDDTASQIYCTSRGSFELSWACAWRENAYDCRP